MIRFALWSFSLQNEILLTLNIRTFLKRQRLIEQQFVHGSRPLQILNGKVSSILKTQRHIQEIQLLIQYLSLEIFHLHLLIGIHTSQMILLIWCLEHAIGSLLMSQKNINNLLRHHSHTLMSIHEFHLLSNHQNILSNQMVMILRILVSHLLFHPLQKMLTQKYPRYNKTTISEWLNFEGLTYLNLMKMRIITHMATQISVGHLRELIYSSGQQPLRVG